MNKEDLRIGTIYQILCPGDEGDKTITKGTYLGRAAPKTGNQRSRGHRFDVGRTVVTVDATRVVGLWKDYEDSSEYLKITIAHLTIEHQRLWREAIKDYAELIAGLAGHPARRVLSMNRTDYGEPTYGYYPHDDFRGTGVKIGLEELIELLKKADYPIPQFHEPTHVAELIKTLTEKLERKESMTERFEDV